MKKTRSKAPVSTAGLQGFPNALSDVAEARRVVETVRLPAIRSQVPWLDACKRLLEAEADGSPTLIETARLSLQFAVTRERFLCASLSPLAVAA